MNGSLNNTGTLSGTGVVAGNVFNSGTLVPSLNSTLTFGTFTNNSGTYQVETSSAGQSDLISVGGAATLNGGTVAVQPQAGPYAPRTTYTILSAAGELTGFASVSDPYPSCNRA